MARKEWPRSCSCGRTWSDREWARLPRIGFGPSPDGRTEIRECICGGAISIPVSRAQDLRRETSRVDLRQVAAAALPHVLVVDDDPLVHDALSKALDGIWRTSTADSGKTMVRALTHGAKFDIILVDVDLPDVDVEQAYARIQKIDAALISRVVFMTGGPEDERLHFLTKVDNAILRKPFPFSLLRDLLDVIRNPPASARRASS